MGVIYKCYCYRRGERYYYTLRANNNAKNAIQYGRYKTRQGRNKKVRELIQEYKNKGAKVAVFRSQTPPKH